MQCLTVNEKAIANAEYVIVGEITRQAGQEIAGPLRDRKKRI